MRKIITLFVFTILLSSCSSEPEFIPIEKITQVDKKFTIEDFKEIKFKQSIEYNVESLPNVISAYYGFIKNDQGEPNDYEIRFYNSHESAIENGKRYAENIIGENGCIKKECSFFLENLKHRQKISEPSNVAGGAGNGIPIPKYQVYIIHGNFILFCPGYNEYEALKTCTLTVKSLE
tara:strand:- start:1116 stop:1646 length:531 start_codon:yes stop_codon:yes gene_type:complete